MPPDYEPPHPSAFAASDILVRAPPGAPPTALWVAAAPGAAAGAPAPAPHTVPAPGGLGAADFETELFAGRIEVAFRLPQGLQRPEAEALFAGRRRLMWVAIQGRFKRPLPLDDASCGSWFARPLRLPGATVLAPIIQWMASRLGGMDFCIADPDNPRLAGPLVAAAQLLNVSRRGEEPAPMAAREDTRLLLGPAAQSGAPMTTAQRQRFFKRPENRAGRCWSPDQVVTMFVFDHAFDYHTYHMNTPLMIRFNMISVLDGQPVEVALHDRASGQFAFRFQVWHRRHHEFVTQHRARIEALAAARAARRAAALRGRATAAAAAAAEAGAAEQAVTVERAAAVAAAAAGAAADGAAEGSGGEEGGGLEVAPAGAPAGKWG
ncbi:hypothetical protein Rsub_11614 [Raphidocelis subcapitata]|uniref:Domain of unknown function at the cortex 1 domain-containing protein n=1 Tax=Raphidocelis subcapitata TaxID=307507 RepID=A0A2V0PHW9_9CHLO|nr:hypothetical protein Rsub_11614 [Raphidocelis subcapitata]|eukprot:GBF99169.1 hypothetical protein Rsub_11614 [Raphidocelis subcapitata]